MHEVYPPKSNLLTLVFEVCCWLGELIWSVSSIDESNISFNFESFISLPLLLLLKKSSSTDQCFQSYRSDQVNQTMQYGHQSQYAEWITPFGFDHSSYTNMNHHRHHHLSSNASSFTDGSSAYGSSSSHLYDILPVQSGRISPELPSTSEVLFFSFYFDREHSRLTSVSNIHRI